MNKLISTEEQVFISLVGPSRSGKLHLTFDWLKIGIFQPKFNKTFFLSTLSTSLCTNAKKL